MRAPTSYIKYISDFVWQIAWGFIRDNESLLAGHIRSKICRTPCFIDTNVIIKNRYNFKGGSTSALYHSTYILNSFGMFQIGDNSHLGAFCYVNACYGRVIIGNNVAVGPGTKIIAYSNHYEKGKLVTEIKQKQDIIIGSNVFIGANSTILPGSIIHDNIIIGAGSIVKGELQENAIYGGTPCKLLRNNWYA